MCRLYSGLGLLVGNAVMRPETNTLCLKVRYAFHFMLKDIVLNLKKESNLDQNGDCTINCTSLTYRKEEKNNQCNQIGLKQIEISNTSNFPGYCNSGNNSTRNTTDRSKRTTDRSKRTTDRSKRTNSHMIALAVGFVIMTKRIPCCYALWRRPGVRTERRA